MVDERDTDDDGSNFDWWLKIRAGNLNYDIEMILLLELLLQYYSKGDDDEKMS